MANEGHPSLDVQYDVNLVQPDMKVVKDERFERTKTAMTVNIFLLIAVLFMLSIYMYVSLQNVNTSAAEAVFPKVGAIAFFRPQNVRLHGMCIS